MTVSRTHQLLSLGQTSADRVRLARTGELVRVRHGAYADEAAHSALDRHRQLIAGTVPIMTAEMVLSHVSAGILHQLPSWESTLGQVTVLRLSGGHGSRRRNLHVRLAPIEGVEITEIDGYPVTSLERTAIDLGCIHAYERAVAVMDAALHREAGFEVMVDTVQAARTRRGVATARAALTFADGRAESVGESISRVRMAAAGLPVPQLQVNVFDEFGIWLARSDFGWEALGVLGEFDGQLKYVGTPEQVARTVMREKDREDRLRELGWVVVRWKWADLADLNGFRRRIEAAIAQANPSAVRGSVRPS
ncbi:MAG: hypothetical protein QM779_07290 [Propionicimonas sp.]